MAGLQVIGIAAQDFRKDGRNKYETRWKADYESYVWSYFSVPSLPDEEFTYTSIQVGRTTAMPSGPLTA